LESEPDLAPEVEVVRCDGGAAAVVHDLTQAAFSGYDGLDPPSGALRETVDSVRRDLEAGGGAVAFLGSAAVACLRFEAAAGDLHVRRVAVKPELQGRGIGRALMAWAEVEAASRGLACVTVGVRLSLPANLAFYRGLGYEVVAEHSHPGYAGPTALSMRKRIPSARGPGGWGGRWSQIRRSLFSTPS